MGGPSARGGPPKKGLIRNIIFFFPNFSIKNRVLKRRFLAFPGGPGGFRELREAGRNHFHLSWYPLVPRITSYGQQNNKEKNILKSNLLSGTLFLKNLV